MLCRALVPGRIRPGCEPAVTAVAINPQLPSPAAADDQIVVAVAVQIIPRDTGAQLTQFFWKERLARKIVVVRFLVFMGDQAADILKEGLGSEAGGAPFKAQGSRFKVRGCPGL